MRLPRTLKVAASIPGRGCTDLYCARGAHEKLRMRVGDYGQSIGSTVSDAIVRSWLWSTTTRVCPFGYLSSITASSWSFIPQSVVVDYPLGDSWPYTFLPLLLYKFLPNTIIEFTWLSLLQSYLLPIIACRDRVVTYLICIVDDICRKLY